MAEHVNVRLSKLEVCMQSKFVQTLYPIQPEKLTWLYTPYIRYLLYSLDFYFTHAFALIQTPQIYYNICIKLI